MKTVGELRKALEGLDDSMEVILSIITDAGDSLLSMSITNCSVECGCTEVDVFVIYADDDPEGEW